MTKGTLQFDVGGRVFSVRRELIENGPPSKLQQLSRSAGTANHFHPISIDRPPDLFAAILAMYQTSELHMPMTSCPRAFLNELSYWEIDVEQLSDCCFTRLQCFLDERNILNKFKNHHKKQDDLSESKFSFGFFTPLKQFRTAMWCILDGKSSSILARIYFVVALLMVLLSIFAIAYGTDRTFQRRVTNCERLEYMISSGMDHVDLVKDALEAECENETIPWSSADAYLFRSFNDMSPAGNDYDYGDDFLEISVPVMTPSDSTIPPPPADFIDGNGNSSANGTYLERPVFALPFIEMTNVKIPNMRVKIYTLVVIDIVTLVFFTVDLLLRVFCCPCILRYFMSIINIADAIALLATYIHYLIISVYKQYRYEDEWMDLLEYLQMLRSLRLFRIVSNVRAGRVLAYTIRENAKDLLILIMFLIAGMCAFASVFYISEDKHMVRSIPNSWYWAIVTMTTVGYGDIVPQTSIGRLLACVCAVSGVLLFALTVPIFANHFLTLYQCVGSKQSVRKEVEKLNANCREEHAVLPNGDEHITSKHQQPDDSETGCP